MIQDRPRPRRRRAGAVAGVAGVLALAAAAAWLVWRPAPPAPPAPGIPLTLAEERRTRVSDLRYALTLAIPGARTEPVRGRVVASFTLADADRPLAFDFAQPADRLLGVTANGRVISAPPVNGHVVIPARRLTTGANRIEFTFVSSDAPLNRADDFMYTLFVPARASLAFPCFDQPDLKARWTVTAEMPAGWTALANGAEVSRQEQSGRVSMTFRETEPLPTYLVALAAGRFSVETASRGGRSLRMFHRETDAARVARNREAIFDLHARALDWMRDYAAVDYPFGKFDFVLLPAFQFSGMEHPGAIYYNAKSLLLDASATQSQYLNRANTIAHETAHMWFGDLVTMRWFNDVWMKEVFANFMAAKIVNPSFPDVNHELRFLLQNYPAAYEVDRTVGANPIRQELANLDEAGSLYGAIIYQKAPIVMRQLEQLVGAGGLRDGLREYLRRYRFGNASWTDLVALLDERTDADLTAWSHAWIDEPGRPTVHVTRRTTRARFEGLTLTQGDPRGRDLIWPQHIDVHFDNGPPRSIELTAADIDVDVPVGRAPRWVLPVGGYGLFDLDPSTLEYISRSLVQIDDPVIRATALVDLWEAMLEGKIAAGRVIDDVLLALTQESHELLVQQMLDDVRVAFWRFTAADDRPIVAPRIEAALRQGLSRASSTSARAAWFDAFRRTAITPGSVEWLTDVWQRKTAIPGLPLSEDDETDLAAELALRDVPDADAILQTQLQRIDNPDRKARFAFLMPALSQDATVRDAFFERLKDPEARQHEAWVLDGARYLHHPLQAGSSRRYLHDALDLTLSIQRTGDIFFPKRWADATLSGYQAVQTAAEVRAFIDGLPPDYPERLRWVLLASADPLFRAAQLLNQ